MPKVFWQTFLASSAFWGMPLLISSSAIAGEVKVITKVADFYGSNSQPNYLQIKNNANRQANKKAMAQVTSVSELSDVKPTDWAFQAVQSLVERYGCIEGYPDKTFRGNRAATRYELAAALNACLNQISAQLGGLSADDLATIKRLQDELAAELATLRGGVDALDARTTELEANQFSTTTKLTGEIIFSAAQAFTDQVAVSSPGVPTEAVDTKTILTNRVWLYVDSSFSGKDRLRTRLQARSTPNFQTVTGTNMTRLAYEGDSGNLLQLSRLEYLLPFAEDRGRLYIEAVGGEFNDNMQTFNPFLFSSGRGSISRFGRFNPIYRLSGNTGLTLTYDLIDGEDTNIALNAGYLAANANLAVNPSGNNGLIGGPFGALFQIDIQPVKNVQFGLTYVHSQNIDPTGGTGSLFGSNPFDNPVDNLALPDNGTQTVAADSFGFEAALRIASKFTLSGWAGYTLARVDSGINDGADAEILNWATTFAFPDLWREGDVAGIVFGMPPKIIRTDIGTREDLDTAYHLEGFYRFQVNDSIAVTPGVIAIFNPEHNSNNDTAILSVIRTTFNF